MTKVERILILAKTYPSPSAKYVETSCIAGINDRGEMRRLYPVPFRLIEENQQFKKWQMVEVRIEKANNDHRPESHKLFIDTIKPHKQIDTKSGWATRREWLQKIPSFESFDAVQKSCLKNNISLALLCPKKVIGLVIKKARNSDWTAEEQDKLVRDQMQGNLFTEDEAKKHLITLRKIPFDFYYKYVCQTPKGEQEWQHKIVDWEVGGLYWKCKEKYGSDWERPFREKLVDDLMSKDLMFLVGNLHRFQNQWLIISLIYPPKLDSNQLTQVSLF